MKFRTTEEEEAFDVLRRKMIQESEFTLIEDLIEEHKKDPEFREAWNALPPRVLKD